MKRWHVGLALTLLWTPFLLRADLVVVQKVEESGPGKQSQEITLKAKGDKIRVDLSPEISVLMDTATGETITLRHTQKTYLQVSAEASLQLAKKMGQMRDTRAIGGIEDEPAKLEATGKRETVAGQETKIYTAQNGAIKMTYWVAQNSPDAEKFLSLLAVLQKAPMVKLAGGLTFSPADFKFPGLPVKTEMGTPDGRKITTTILSIKEQPLEEIDFTVPPGYRSLPKPLFGPNTPLNNP